MNATQKKLRVSTPADNEIVVEREFDAPRHLVWRCYTEAELIRRWWHTGRGEMTVCEMDAREGGTYRFAMTAEGPEGEMEVAFTGKITEVVEGEKMAAYERYEGMPGPQGPTGDGPLNIFTLKDLEGGRTRMTLKMECSGQQERDAILGSGMTDGMEDAFDLLEKAAKEIG